MVRGPPGNILSSLTVKIGQLITRKVMFSSSPDPNHGLITGCNASISPCIVSVVIVICSDRW